MIHFTFSWIAFVLIERYKGGRYVLFAPSIATIISAGSRVRLSRICAASISIVPNQSFLSPRSFSLSLSLYKIEDWSIIEKGTTPCSHKQQKKRHYIIGNFYMTSTRHFCGFDPSHKAPRCNPNPATTCNLQLFLQITHFNSNRKL